jgi:hypothetical protein
LEDFQAQQIQMEKDKNSPSARSLTAQRVHIHTEFGRVSPLQGLFNMTIISERECGQAGCPAITRSFTEANLIHLAFPVGASNDTSHTLEELLEQMTQQLDKGGECEMDKSHTRGKFRLNRIAHAPTYLVIAFNRQGSSFVGASVWSQVKLPIKLDISPYAHGVRFPSELISGETLDEHSLPYRICAVIMFNHSHYVAFVHIDGEWICFDGMNQSRRAHAKSPFAAAKDNWLPAMVVYEREKSGVHTPAAQTSTATPEDDEMQVDDEVQVTDDATPDGLDAQLQRLREEQEKVEKLHVEMQKSLNEQEVRLDQEKKSQTEREQRLDQQKKLQAERDKSLSEQERRLDQEKKSQVERERLKTEERRQKLEKRQQELQANKESIGRSQEQRAHLAAQEAELDQRNGQILQEMIGEEVSDVEG